MTTCDLIHIALVIIIVVVGLAHEILMQFPIPNVKFLRCFYCANRTMESPAECLHRFLKRKSCGNINDFINKKSLEGYSLVNITYKCGQVQYVGNKNQLFTFSFIIHKYFILDSKTTKVKEDRGCVGVYRNYTFCDDIKYLYEAASVLFCEECDINDCNPGYKFPNKAQQMCHPNIIVFFIMLILSNISK